MNRMGGEEVFREGEWPAQWREGDLSAVPLPRALNLVGLMIIQPEVTHQVTSSQVAL